VWFVGGSVAIALGVGAAVWLAGGTDEPTPASKPTQPVAMTVTEPANTPANTPAITPAITPAPTPATPQAIELRFDSLPSGGVFADGKSAELCHTPCTLKLDLSDGGPPDHRTFIIKSAGYRDSVVDVDLAGTKREFSVRLAQLTPTLVERPPVADVKTTKGTKVTKSTKATASSKTTKPAPPVASDLGKKDSASDLEDPTDDGKKPTDKIKKPSGTKIDAADTLDPFRKRP
jgi:hypothetical protein